MRRGWWTPALVVALAACSTREAGSGPARGRAPRPGVAESVSSAELRPVAGQTIYVPVYSHVNTADSARPYNLAITLSVRNADRAEPIVVTKVAYHDTDGTLVRDELSGPVRLAPLATIEFFVPENDASGGSSASFLVAWIAERPVAAPVVEAVMIGTAGTQGISFVCPGRVVEERAR